MVLVNKDRQGIGDLTCTVALFNGENKIRRNRGEEKATVTLASNLAANFCQILELFTSI
jgi:hypothetical protein